VTRAEYVRSYYGVPAARGQRVTFDGSPGRITGFRDSYILVRLDSEPGRLLTLHPTWRVDYLTEGTTAQ
jgi:hypothetical protein